jgi:hypothetical protein
MQTENRMLSPEADIELERHSATAGVDANVLRKFVENESGGNPNAKAATSSAAGLFQFTSGTWNDLARRYPHLNLNNRMDPVQQARIAPYYLSEIKNHARSRMGRDLGFIVRVGRSGKRLGLPARLVGGGSDLWVVEKLPNERIS